MSEELRERERERTEAAFRPYQMSFVSIRKFSGLIE